MELTRKQKIQRLVMMKSYAIGEDYEALEYAINSLKTDEAYQLIYEGAEVYDKDTVFCMFRELQLDIKNHTMTSGVTNQGTWNECIACCSRVIQQKIDDLKGREDHEQV